MNRNKSSESGNALWFVMLGITLLAALTITITRSSDSVEQSGDFERYRIHATNLMRYTKGIQQAIQEMSLRGVSENDVSFDAPDWGHNDYRHTPVQPNKNKIFHQEGAGLAYRNIQQATNWSIFGSHRVDGVETTRNDLIMQAEVDKNICMQINTILEIDNPLGDAPVDPIDAVDEYVGSFADGAGVDLFIGDDAGELNGEPVGCRKDGTSYFYYHVLIER
jgi:hypothetical protein